VRKRKGCEERERKEMKQTIQDYSARKNAPLFLGMDDICPPGR
jgi:hypothetical protein